MQSARRLRCQRVLIGRKSYELIFCYCDPQPGWVLLHALSNRAPKLVHSDLITAFCESIQYSDACAFMAYGVLANVVEFAATHGDVISMCPSCS